APPGVADRCFELPHLDGNRHDASNGRPAHQRNQVLFGSVCRRRTDANHWFSGFASVLELAPGNAVTDGERSSARRRCLIIAFGEYYRAATTGWAPPTIWLVRSRTSPV